MRLAVEDVVVGELPELTSRRFDQPLFAETEGGAPQPGHRLDILLAVFVEDMDALAAGDDERALALMLQQVGIGMKMMGDVAAHGRIGALHGGNLVVDRAHYGVPRAEAKAAPR